MYFICGYMFSDVVSWYLGGRERKKHSPIILESSIQVSAAVRLASSLGRASHQPGDGGGKPARDLHALCNCTCDPRWFVGVPVQWDAVKMGVSCEMKRKQEGK